MVRKLIPASLLALATLASSQTYYHDRTPEDHIKEKHLTSTLTDILYRKETPATFGYPITVQFAVGGYSTPPKFRAFIAWKDHFAGTTAGPVNRLDIPINNPLHQMFVYDMTTVDLSGKMLVYITGSINTSGFQAYPFLQVFEWTGQQLVPASGIVRLSNAIVGWNTKVAGDNKGNFYAVWDEGNFDIAYRKFRFKATAPYYEFVSGPKVIDPSPYIWPEYVRNVDVAFNMGGIVTIAALSQGDNLQRILSWQIDDSTGFLSHSHQEYQTSTENIDSMSIATHWRPKGYNSWPFGVTVADPYDYMIAFSASDGNTYSVNTVGVDSGSPIGPTLINTENSEFLSPNYGAKIAGSDLFYEVVWSHRDTQGIFQGSGGTTEILSHTLDTNGLPTKTWPYGHKLVNSDLYGSQGAPSIGIGRGYNGNGMFGVAFANNLADPLDEFAPPLLDLSMKLVTTAYY